MMILLGLHRYLRSLVTAVAVVVLGDRSLARCLSTAWLLKLEVGDSNASCRDVATHHTQVRVEQLVIWLMAKHLIRLVVITHRRMVFATWIACIGWKLWRKLQVFWFQPSKSIKVKAATLSAEGWARVRRDAEAVVWLLMGLVGLLAVIKLRSCGYLAAGKIWAFLSWWTYSSACHSQVLDNFLIV